MFSPAGAAVHDSSGGGRRLAGLTSDDLPAQYFSHRREMRVETAANGRRMAVAAQPDTNGVPAPLILMATTTGTIAAGLCRMASENHFDIAIPFDPYQIGIRAVVARFKAATMLGCDHLDTFGFGTDFSIVWTTGGDDTHWHIDCPAPATPTSACTVSRVYLIAQPPDLNAASNIDQTDVISVPLEDNTGNTTSRRLAPGE